ncbi:non-ribosomal peptide synthetase [Azohydromonas lata]|uniref:Amino acid adenylation domain-containing protein n=1 Tax=Azohydromonas lata TaxID=45677 RepID=A0ABU5IEJ1_9BURK|nr:non-ribosomal peptide synthetase [Azohydromonas lata]MDZ5457372.1 amino acid adenylation domain-containing protein [Azohydromonas lata]
MTTHTTSSQPSFVHPSHFVERLGDLMATCPDDTALIVVADQGGESVETVLCYRDFGLRVRALAAVLQQRFEKGARVLILLDNDEHYAVSMFACFHAGVVAVPVFPPESARPQHLARLAGIAADAQARGVLTARSPQALVGEAARQFGNALVIAVDDVDPLAAAGWHAHEPAASDVAFLQYTSGSTSAPKGVMVTHGNLMANERAIHEGLGIGSADRFGVWSPLFHDMGLIGGLLQPFYSGIPCVLASPRYFLERPVRWLEMISRYRVTISGGPDFAYRLCVDRVKDAQLEGLDLSSWRVAYTGAEPVRHDTMDAFIARYASVGFDAAAVYPCYGLAEATLFVTGGRRGSGMVVSRFDGDALAARQVACAAEGAALVGCGRVPSGHDVRIADPETGVPATPQAIGEIWAAGPSMAAGYWNQPEQTAQTFVERDAQRWLRTGDLGFVHGGQLFVTGRLKDMIIVRGHNLYPQDIERVVEDEVEAVRKGRVTAFSVAGDGGEGIGVAAEISRGLQKLVVPQALVDAISAAVSAQCGEAPRAVLLLNPGALPKTSSGKLQRAACRQGWARRSLDAYAIFENGRFVSGGATQAVMDAVQDDTAQALAALWCEGLSPGAARPYAGDAHFFAAGGNSLAAVQLAAHVSQRWSIEFPVRMVFDHPRLQEQAEVIRRGVALGARPLVPTIAVLPAGRRAGPLPLSAAQRRQWFLWQLDPQGTAYHVHGALRLAGALDAAAMQLAVQGLAQRHESLRTVFHARPDGEVEQLVLPQGALDLQWVDLRELAGGEREPQAMEVVRSLLAQPFDLTRGPPVRATLVRVADEVHVLALVTHHIVADGASMQVIVDELPALYAAALAGEAATLPLTLQYADCAAWQHEHPQTDAREQQLAYWREQLGAAPGEAQPVLDLPTDHPRRAVARYRAARHRLEVSAGLEARLRQQARRQGVTLFAVLLAAFQVLLHRGTGQCDIRIGVPVANRDRPENQRVVGLFVNTVVLRNVIDGRMPLAQVLARAAQAAFGAQAHQALPFDQLVEALQPARSLSVSPMFQAVFNHLVQDFGAFERVAGLHVDDVGMPGPEAQFEIVLEARERVGAPLALDLVYAAELFEAETMARTAGHYLAVLEAMAADTNRAVGDVALLGAPERAELLRWSVNGHREPGDAPVHHGIARQALQRPDAVALLFGDEVLSYAQLDRRANRLAHRLLSLGVRPEDRVGVAMVRSVELVVSVLAILKAGAAYLPLDPEYPAARLAHMVDDSGIRLLLTHGPARGCIAARDGLAVLEVDAIDLEAGPASDPGVPLHGDQLAYVIYTSGSTGLPKGVAVRHEALRSCMAWMQRAYRLTQDDTVLHKAPFGFDVSVWEMFWPLTAGARLLVAQPGDHRDPQRLVQLIERHQVTTLNFVPSMLQAFLAHPGIETRTRLRYVICGGEAMPAPVQAEALQRLRGASLQNLYGPTETTIHVTQWTCRDDGHSLVPIGRPISDTQAWVLDAELNQVPRGVAGELYLGGVSLARGYLSRAALTAGRFIADPFGQGGRLYRTGDLVRWNTEGQIEYLGRIDHQVKLRGLRIELGEIEAALLAQPAIREAVVVAQDGPGGPTLVAYVAAHPGHLPDPAVLRERLGPVLPDFMVPRAVVVLDALPLSANGKVDRAALPAAAAPVRAQRHEVAQGGVAQALAALWSEVLQVADVGLHDNFFDLGGHSLLLIRVHRLLEERLRIVVPLLQLFKHPTVGSLAQAIEQGGSPADAGGTAAVDAQALRKRTAMLQRRKAAERVD